MVKIRIDRIKDENKDGVRVRKAPSVLSGTKDRLPQAERSGTDPQVPIRFTAGLPTIQENIVVQHSGSGLDTNPACSRPSFIGATGK